MKALSTISIVVIETVSEAKVTPAERSSCLRACWWSSCWCSTSASPFCTRAVHELERVSARTRFPRCRFLFVDEGWGCGPLSRARHYLQVLFAAQRRPLRMVEPIVQPTFGPRAGHGNLSSWTTPRRCDGHHRRGVLRGEATHFDPLFTMRCETVSWSGSSACAASRR